MPSPQLHGLGLVGVGAALLVACIAWVMEARTGHIPNGVTLPAPYLG